MNRVGFVFATLGAIAWLLFSKPAIAAYAQLAPPAGWSAVGSQGMMQVGTTATVGSGRIAANATTNVAGRLVTVPVSMRLAANAAQFALQGLRVTPAGLITSAAVSFAAAYGLVWLDEQWQQQYEAEGFCWRHGTVDSGCLATAAVAAAAAASIIDAAANTCPGGTYRTTLGAGTVTYLGTETADVVVPYTGHYCSDGSLAVGSQPRVVRVNREAGTELALRPAVASDFDVAELNDPLPDELPADLPFPLPVEVPVINPSPDTVPIPQPLRVPLGEPVPVPDADPARWDQPVADIVPSNRPAEPWRVDLQPKVIPLDSPDGLTDPETPGSGDPAGVPKDEQQQLCEAFPDIAACQKLGEAPASQALPVIDMPASMDETVSFGPETAACPADRVMNTTLAGTLHFSYGGACMFADGIRPIVVGMAYLAAVLSFFGFSKRD